MTRFCTFESDVVRGKSRVGRLKLRCNDLVAPYLESPMFFPATSKLMAGNMTDPENPILDRWLPPLIDNNLPMLTLALFWFDANQSIERIREWRNKGVREAFHEIGYTSYDAPFFLDSGGFKLTNKPWLDLSKWDIRREAEQQDILAIQLDLGGEILASFDYPLPLRLERGEAEARMEKSLQNIGIALDILGQQERPPYLYACCHGQYPLDLKDYVAKVYDRYAGPVPFGVAIGSITSRDQVGSLVLSMIKMAREGIPDEYKDSTPIHVLGVSGELMPIFAAFGGDSFDSMTYLRYASGRRFIDPKDYSLRHISTLDPNNLGCDCYGCRNNQIKEYQKALADNVRVNTTFNSYVAYHNLQLYFSWLEELREAIKADDHVNYLVKYIKEHQIDNDVVHWVAEQDHEIAKKLSRNLTLFSLFEDHFKVPKPLPKEQTISLAFDPNSFCVPREYTPPAGKNILLVVPETTSKPYSIAPLHVELFETIDNAMDGCSGIIHKVTLSGLYGPVPQEFENREEVVRSHYQLTNTDTDQIRFLIKRLEQYVNRYASHYDVKIAYAPARGYRMICERVRKLKLYPTERKQSANGLNDPRNVDELCGALVDALKSDSDSQLSFT